MSEPGLGVVFCACGHPDTEHEFPDRSDLPAKCLTCLCPDFDGDYIIDDYDPEDEP